MTSGPEWALVEGPLLENLFSLGWETLVWSQRQAEDRVSRSSDRDVLLEERLRSALLTNNRGLGGDEWLDDGRIDSAVAELRSLPAGVKLLEANQVSTQLLLEGVPVAGIDGWRGGRDQTINYIDWENWEVNDFLAVSQFTVATPGQAPNIRPDVTLFVNGIPLVVIEAKPRAVRARSSTPSINFVATPTSAAARFRRAPSSCSGRISSQWPPPA